MSRCGGGRWLRRESRSGETTGRVFRRQVLDVKTREAAGEMLPDIKTVRVNVFDEGQRNRDFYDVLTVSGTVPRPNEGGGCLPGIVECTNGSLRG